MGEVVELNKEPDLICSGGELPHGASDVWAIAVLKRGKAHFFKRDRYGYYSLCDAVDVPAFLGNGQCSIFAAGTFPKCKNCMRKLQKLSAK